IVAGARDAMTTLDPAVDGYTYGGRPLQPMRALRAFNRLIRDKEDTTQVFEIMEALAGRSIPWGLNRLLRPQGGARMAYERVELAERFDDDAWLARFGPGSVGAAYRDFMRGERLSAEGLAKQSEAVRPEIQAPNLYAWYGRRLRDIH